MKKYLILSIGVIMAIAMYGCGSSAGVQDTDNETESTSIANPWRECTEEEAYEYAPNGFSAPEGATNVVWSLYEPTDDPFDTMVQLTFDDEELGLSFTARQQAVSGEEITDISGLNYDWTAEDDDTLKYWGDGQMPCKTYRYISDDEMVDLCLWFDIETGEAYSLSTQSTDLDGFDIIAVAESIYDPAKQVGANAPSDEELEEISAEFIESVAEENAPDIDISGCDTFTQIVDTVLTSGMGYANEKVSDTDVFFVTDYTYDNLDGNNATIDATLFIYKDDAPFEIGKVASGGTAYPLTIKDGFLYTASNHWICKYAVENDTLNMVEMAAVVYSSNGDATYYYDLDGESADITSEGAEEQFNSLFDEMTSGDVIDFATVE